MKKARKLSKPLTSAVVNLSQRQFQEIQLHRRVAEGMSRLLERIGDQDREQAINILLTELPKWKGTP